MASSSLFLRVNPGGPLLQEISDLGIVLSRSVTNNEFVGSDEILSLSGSADLLSLATDDAYGADSSTVLVSTTDGGTSFTTDVVAAILGGFLTEPANYRLRIESLFNYAYKNHYSEFSYTGNNLIQIDIWENNSMTIKLFTRTLSYTGKNLTGVVTTDELTGCVLTTSLVYSGKNLVNTTKVVS